MTIGGENSHGRRKRRTHHKSRRGCRNCKLRRVKCDEARPGCKKCSNFGVSCNYDDPNAPDLQTICHTVTWRSAAKGLPPKSARSSMESCFSVAKVEVLNSLRPGLPCLSDDGKSTILLDIECQGRLDRFITRTVLTIGTPHVSVIFQAELSSIIYDSPYLMHMVQALTALHDRILSPNPDAQQTKAELYHASRAAALFNAKLSKPLQQEDRDPMWATAALLGIAAMCWIEASCAEDSWPLTVRKPSDLDWIRISRSKVAIWNLTDPLRKGSRFRRMAEEQHQSYESASVLVAKLGIGELPGKLLTLCEVDEHATVDSNRYLLALQMLGPAMAVEATRANLLVLLSFISSINDDFQELLRERDPRALLLMAFWYAKINGAMWWLDRRSILEGQAICMYLERYHADEAEIMELLSYPKAQLGMLT